MTHVCEDCDSEFETVRGLETHVGKMHDPLPERTLVELYVYENLSAPQIADRLDLTESAVKNRLTKHGLWGKDPVRYHTDPNDGYPVFTHTGVTGRGSRVREHRVLAIATGADPHDVFSGDLDVHHVNGIKFDNRPENVEVVPHDEHTRLHHDS